MSERVALDTNILIYAVSQNTDPRNEAALEIVRRSFALNAIVPLQVLGEFLNVCRRKRVAAPAAALERVAEWLPLFATPRTEIAHLIEASASSNQYDLAYFDALICALASTAGATRLISEDMHDGLRVNDLVIVDPFAAHNRILIDHLLEGAP